MIDSIISKEHFGWAAKSEIPLPGIKGWAKIGSSAPLPAFLRVSTLKSSRGLASHATVAYLGDGFVRTVQFRDYDDHVAKSDARCTEKNIRALHAEALQLLPCMLAQIAAHFGVDDPTTAPSKP